MTYVKTQLKREITIPAIITIHYFEYMKDFAFKGESHDFWEFLYVDKGNILVRAGDRELQMGAGDIVFHEPNEFHAFRAVGKSAINLVAVSFVTDSPGVDFFRKKAFILNEKERLILSALVSAAREALSTPINIPWIEQVGLREDAPYGAQQMILLNLELFLLTLRREREEKADDSKRFELTEETAHLKSSRLIRVVHYMQEHVQEQIDMNTLCDVFYMSRSTLQHLFHKEFGCGPMEYFSRMKIRRAREMMREENCNITEIAARLSYGSVQYFSRQFKKETGMSPMEYLSSVKGIAQVLK
uniref:helix-turn-helix domain-containing protein n=1 Tax=Eisenbergiella sp. TaxID=1924109 RepID=UPI003FEE61D7